jgi:uncharacterized DUF497 family protein
MDGIRFEWDPKKNRLNKARHGISFEEAKTAFFDEHARVMADPEHSGDEERFVLLGLSIDLRILVVCHCYREPDRTIRIISARKADPSERSEYAGFLP